MPRGDNRLVSLRAAHERAVREFVERAEAVGDSRWLVPRAEGKWTPAQEVRHLILTYTEFLRQLTERTPIRLRGTPVRRLVWRGIGLTSILWFRRIPVAVKAPREVRPEPEGRPASQLIPEMQTKVETFHAEFERAWRSRPRPRLAHPLFGGVSLDQGIRFLTVHTRHHAAFLPPVPHREKIHEHRSS